MLRHMFSFAVTDDLTLELLEPMHASALFKLVDANREHLRPWMPWVDTTETVEDIQTFISSGLDQYAKRNGFQLGLFYQEKIIGVLGLHYINWTIGNTEMGYWLSKDAQSRGLMTMAVAALLEKLFEHYKLARVEIRANTENLRSRAIPKRLGFLQEGILRQAGMNNGQSFDMVVYGLLKEEWHKEEWQTNREAS